MADVNEIVVTPAVKKLYTGIAEQSIKQKEALVVFNNNVRQDFLASSEQLASLLFTATMADKAGFDAAKAAFRDAVLTPLVEDYQSVVVNGD